MTARSGRSDLSVFLLDADLYLWTTTQVEHGAERLVLTEWVNPGRLIFSIVLGLAGVIAVHRLGGYGAGAIVGGLLLFPAVFVGSVVQQKAFNRIQREISKKTWLLGIPVVRTEEMLGGGSVLIQSEFYRPDEGQGYWEFGVFVDGDTTGRIVSRDYERATKFGRELADFLGLGFFDATSAESRSGRPPA